MFTSNRRFFEYIASPKLCYKVKNYILSIIQKFGIRPSMAQLSGGHFSVFEKVFKRSPGGPLGDPQGTFWKKFRVKKKPPPGSVTFFVRHATCATRRAAPCDIHSIKWGEAPCYDIDFKCGAKRRSATRHIDTARITVRHDGDSWRRLLSPKYEWYSFTTPMRRLLMRS